MVKASGMLLRRQLFRLGLATVLPAPRPLLAASSEMAFPRAGGSHPDQGIEWWYVTGSASAGSRRFGFQITFFRSRVQGTESLKSAFAARQLIFAHAALTDLSGGRLWHAQRIARAGFGLAEAAEGDTHVQLNDWSLRRRSTQGGGSYEARMEAPDFAFELDFVPTQPLLLQGPEGRSQKGPDPREFSHYYSEPQLQVLGRLRLQQQHFEIVKTAEPGWNRAWLDHEWSQQIMAPEAAGWDWVGINLFDGGALMAFRMRTHDGQALWDACTWREANGQVHWAPAGQTRWRAERVWQSPLSQAQYPVEWTLDCPGGRFRLKALLDTQELDSRASTGAIYWEGLCELSNDQQTVVGRGYLEMTGYAAALRL